MSEAGCEDDLHGVLAGLCEEPELGDTANQQERGKSSKATYWNGPIVLELTWIGML
jgi:hypothetical protein